VTGTVGGDFAQNGNNLTVDFDHVAAGMGAMRAFVENNRDIPANVKATVAEGLSDIQAEASAAVPSLEMIRGTMKFLVDFFPGVKAIAKSVGVPWFA
jgi:hypothetical protein